jgi:SAM-dependent methyltransferase
VAERDWLDVARSATADDLREWILTGFKSGKPFTPYVPTISLPPRLNRVLDFGCGVGRNFPYLRRIARHVTGFDLPPMIARCREIAPVAADALSHDWPAIRQERFDLVFASLVFQHIEPEATRAYLTDIASMAPAVYLLTRGQSDFAANVIDLVARLRLFTIDDCVIVEHDAATHQLRVLGREPVDAARREGNMAHYELMLNVKTVDGDGRR